MEQNFKTPKFPKLEGLLASRGISYVELGNAFPDENGEPMNDQAVRRRMNGTVNFDLEEIYKLCVFLNCEFADIFGE